MRKVSKAILAAVGAGAVALATVPAFGQGGGTITLETANFVRTSSSFDSTPEADFTGVTVPFSDDHLYESGWWYRVLSDSHESPLGVPGVSNYSFSHSDLGWSNVGGRGLFSAWEYSDLNGHFPGADVTHSLEITSLIPDDLVIEIFHMVDIDLQPAAGDDVGVLEEWGQRRLIRIDDSGGHFAVYAAYNSAAKFLARANGSSDVGAVLGDLAITDFDNSGLPFGPGDLTAGYAFPFVIPPFGRAYAGVSIYINHAPNCEFLHGQFNGVFCDGFEIGNRSVWSTTAP